MKFFENQLLLIKIKIPSKLSKTAESTQWNMMEKSSPDILL